MRSTWAALSRFWTEQREFSERLSLMERPWEEQYLHWSFEDGEYVLHGNLMPSRRRRMSATRGGWCLQKSAGFRRHRHPGRLG